MGLPRAVALLLLGCTELPRLSQKLGLQKKLRAHPNSLQVSQPETVGDQNSSSLSCIADLQCRQLLQALLCSGGLGELTAAEGESNHEKYA